ncbi:MAG: tripartite tricarboxylate transporter substrate binding protein [Polaromonas sp.]
MKKLSYRFLLAPCVLAFASLNASAQPGQSWPTQPVKIVVPFQAGAATDQISRQLGAALGQKFGQPFIIENRPGAAAMIGSDAVARAPNDGYTLLMSGPASMVTNRFLYKKLAYIPDDFQKIALVAFTPNLLLSNPSLPFSSLSEMVVYAKAHPGQLSYASFGTGTTSHMAGERLRKMAGIDILHVPFKGAGEAIPALLSGQVSMYFDTIMTALPLVNAGRLRALGVSNNKRSAMAPTVPTVAEQGYPGYNIAPWYGLVAPKGTPPEVVKKLNAAINQLLIDPSFREKLAATGAEPMGGSIADFETFIKEEIPRTEELIKLSGVSMQ